MSSIQAPNLAGFCGAAHQTCEEIATFDPDVILTLMHSGEAPLRATQVFWSETQPNQPFPSVARINLGREKWSLYYNALIRIGRHDLTPFQFPVDTFTLGHWLAWMEKHTDVQEVLLAQLKGIFGYSAPRRILILDDWESGGKTKQLVLGLLKIYFPLVETRFAAGFGSNWCGRLGEAWLKQVFPRSFARMQVADAELESKGKFPRHIKQDLCLLVPGTEDIAPESAAWQPITLNSDIISRLEPFLPAASWLSLSPWAYQTIEAQVRAYAHAWMSGESPRAEPQKSLFARSRPQTGPSMVFSYRLWRDRRTSSLAESPKVIENIVRQFDRFESGAALECQVSHPNKTYILRSRFGILAYGSLLAEPGVEIANVVEERIENVATPFAVEYARSSRNRAGAPTLVPVLSGIGAPVMAQILVIRPDTPETWTKDIMYRREIRRVGEERYSYNHERQTKKSDGVCIKEVYNLAGIPEVLYIDLESNLNFVFDRSLTIDEKAARLAHLAVESLKSWTYDLGRDGIRYLADALRYGIHTPLTEAYCAAILKLADNAPDLETARQRLAKRRGLIT